MEWATGMAWGCASGGPSGVRAPDRIFERFFGPIIRERRLDQPSERRRVKGEGRLVAALLLLLAAASVAGAQDEVLQRLNIDKLQITSLGVSFGRILPSQVEAANVVGMQADYGNISPTWRVVFGASYWESRFEEKVVQAFADSLHKSLANPSDHVVSSPIRLYDVTFSGDLRYTPNYSG